MIGRIFATIAVAVLASCAQPKRDAVIPASTVITTPSENVPAEFAAFSGVWTGNWGSCLPGKLAVKTISDTGAVETVYSWGDCAQWDIQQGWTERSGQIEDGVLRLEQFGNGALASYQIAADGSLAGTYLRDGNTTRGTFTKE